MSTSPSKIFYILLLLEKYHQNCQAILTAALKGSPLSLTHREGYPIRIARLQLGGEVSVGEILNAALGGRVRERTERPTEQH